jgi:hypothetical protein
VPNDNVAAVVEVKSTMRSEEFIDAADKALKAKELIKTPESSAPRGIQNIATFFTVFAFNSEISNIGELHAKTIVGRGITKHIDTICVLDKTISYTSMQAPGEPYPQPAIISGIGTNVGKNFVVGIRSENHGQNTLDVWFRILLAQLAFFRHRTDHPGFNWDRSSAVDSPLFTVPAKDPERNDPCICLSGKKWKKCHGK